jgi:hypothetical protein
MSAAGEPLVAAQVTGTHGDPDDELGQDGSKKDSHFSYSTGSVARADRSVVTPQFGNFSTLLRKVSIAGIIDGSLVKMNGGIEMKTKALIAGFVMAGSLLAQLPVGPRGRGQMGIGGPGGQGRGGASPAATVVGAPCSAVEVTTSQQVLAAGNTIQRQEQSNLYRDSQGRIRRETTSTGPDGQPQNHVTISDPVAGVVYELDAKNKVAFSRPARFLTPLQTAAAERQRGDGRRPGSHGD